MSAVDSNTLSCGVVLARRAEEGWLTLMLRAWHHWDFPKGLREEGEEPLEAAVREVGEETGIRELDFAWGERCIETGWWPSEDVLPPGLRRAARAPILWRRSSSPSEVCEVPSTRERPPATAWREAGWVRSNALPRR